MFAAPLNIAQKKFELTELPCPTPEAGEVLLKVNAASLNHIERWAAIGAFPFLGPKSLLGADAVGTVLEVGDATDLSWIDQVVIVNPALFWGGSDMPSSRFHILGLGRPGAFAEYLTVPASYVRPCPRHLSTSHAAALPMAGLTAYRALFKRAGLKAGEKVLITGIGGGVALQALQFAIAAGAQVYVTSSSKQKISQAVDLGAKDGVLYTTSDWPELLASQAGAFQVVLDSSGRDLNQLINVTDTGGRIVSIGMTSSGEATFPITAIFSRQISLIGSTMGSEQDFDDMLAFVSQHQLSPVVDKVFPLSEINNAFEWQQHPARFGKIVLALK